MKDDFGDRMKHYEAIEGQRRLDLALPVIIRVDGRRFSKFTRGFSKPFDQDLSFAMRATARALVDEMQARIGYVQSDEITLVLLPRSDEDELLFSGRVQKLTGIAAALATSRFTLALAKTHPDIVARRMPVFDARVWSVPNLAEAANAVLWRVFDARKNSVSAACRSVATTSEMKGLDQSAMISLMAERGVDYETRFAIEDRLGVVIRKEMRESEIAEDVWNRIPQSCRPDDRRVVRSVVVEDPASVFLDTADRISFIFGEERKNHSLDATIPA